MSELRPSDLLDDIRTRGEIARGPLPQMSGRWRCVNADVNVDSGETGERMSAQYENSVECGGTTLRMSVRDVVEGAPYSAEGTLSFDVDKGEFVESWSDSYGFTFFGKGKYSADKKSLVLEGEVPSDGKPAVVRSEYIVENGAGYRYRLTNVTENVVLKDVTFARA